MLPKPNVDNIAAHTRFLLLSVTNNDMSQKSSFAIPKAIIGIGGEPKSVKRLRSGDLLIETSSALQTKSFLLAKSFLDSPITISPQKTLNSCRGVISESDLLTTPAAEILDGFSDQGVIQRTLKNNRLRHIAPEKLTKSDLKKVTPTKNLKETHVKNTSLKIAREEDSLHESTPVSKRSRRWKTLDAMDTDADPSDTDYGPGRR
ncbi:uncharacterized protein TNCV_1189831 [Trichonephila clavipes]|nr:uncharacterized protein TNCV_1189831 [Trichonephila clavipes]